MRLYASAIFVGSFLLFQIQPMIAKMILPWFGGSAAVWITVHALLPMCAAAGLSVRAPVLVRRLGAGPSGPLPRPGRGRSASAAGRPGTGLEAARPRGPHLPDPRPAGGLASVCRTSPSRARAPSCRRGTPAAAGPGCPTGCLPSPTWPRSWGCWPTRSWSSPTSPCRYSRGRGRPVTPFSSRSSWWPPRWTTCALTGPGGNRSRARPPPGPPPAAADRAMWVVWSACGVALLLSVTNHLTQNIAPVPFLWILPLGLYLLSFILCFNIEQAYIRSIYLGPVALVLVGLGFAILRFNSTDAAGDRARGVLLRPLRRLHVLPWRARGPQTRDRPVPDRLLPHDRNGRGARRGPGGSRRPALVPGHARAGAGDRRAAPGC